VFRKGSLCNLPAWPRITEYWDTQIVPPPVFTVDEQQVKRTMCLVQCTLHNAHCTMHNALHCTAQCTAMAIQVYLVPYLNPLSLQSVTGIRYSVRDLVTTHMKRFIDAQV
jgi:hypothetical protein